MPMGSIILIFVALLFEIERPCPKKPCNPEIHFAMKTSLDKGTQRKTTENELPSLTQCTA